jgi:hypothetical protein
MKAEEEEGKREEGLKCENFKNTLDLVEDSRCLQQIQQKFS